MFTRIFLLVTVLIALWSAPADAQQAKRQFIRDAEVENTIRDFCTPIFQVAGLDPQAVRILLLNDPTLNAYVAGGQNIFIHTGLIMRSENPGQLIGVIAHESGHIVGGHLIRLNDAVANASTEAILAMLLGAAAGAVSGNGQAGAGVMMGGQEMAMRNLLAFSRSQEQQADQMAMRFLDDTHWSARGMLEFFNILGDQELLVSSRQDPYVRTHPLTRDRVAFVREHVEKSPYSDRPWPADWVERHRRIKVKLQAFLDPPSKTLMRFKEDDPSLEARYARSIAYYRKPDLPAALRLIDGLLAERPQDPYFWELKGQMLFENGHPRDAVDPYRKAVEYLPNSALLRIGLGQAEIESDDATLLSDAAANLTIAVRLEPEDAFGWQQLAIAFGRDGNEGMASYALAEYFLLAGKLPEANYHANKAEQALGHKGPIWLRLQDIKAQAAEVKAIQDRDRSPW